MIKSFAAFELTPEHIAVVFPLVHMAAADIDLVAWQDFVRRLVDSGPSSSSGAIGLRNGAGYICGVLVFRVDHDLQHGRVLAIDLFVSLDLIRAEEATDALLQVTECKARELQCAATRIRLNGAQKFLTDRFAAAGYCREASLFCKTIAPAPVS